MPCMKTAKGNLFFSKVITATALCVCVCVWVSVSVVQLLVVNTPFTLTGPVDGIRAPNSLMTAGPKNNVGF